MKRSSLFTALMFAGAVAGCGDSGTTDGGGGGCDTVTSGAEAKFVADSITVPQSKAMFQMDINGDGKADNQLGLIIAALTAQGLNTQDSVTTAVSSGQVALLIDESGDDLTTSKCAQTVIESGVKPTTAPKFDGTDTFTVDSTLGSGTFKGKVTGGTFNSNSPITATTPTSLNILLPLVEGGEPLKLSITAAHLQFTKSGDNIMSGQLNGAIPTTSVQGDIVPAVAKLLSDKIAAGEGNSSTNDAIKSLFDDGGSVKDPACTDACKNPDGSCAMAGDGVISICEVSTNSIIQNVLSPDVQIFDGTTYKPNKENTMKDSLSIGIGFTAKKASF